MVALAANTLFFITFILLSGCNSPIVKPPPVTPPICPDPIVCPPTVICKDPVCPLPPAPVLGVISADGQNLGEATKIEPCFVKAQLDAPTFNVMDSTMTLTLNATGLLDGDTVLASVDAQTDISTVSFRTIKLYFWCVTGSTVPAPSPIFDPSIPESDVIP